MINDSCRIGYSQITRMFASLWLLLTKAIYFFVIVFVIVNDLSLLILDF